MIFVQVPYAAVSRAKVDPIQRCRLSDDYPADAERRYPNSFPRAGGGPTAQNERLAQIKGSLTNVGRSSSVPF